MSTTDATPAAEAPRPWVRGLYMLIFVVFFAVAETVLALLALVQFGWMVAYREPQPTLKSFGAAMAKWLEQVVRFQTAATEDKPFPWAPWPGEK